ESSTDNFRPRENLEARTLLSSLKKMGMKIAVVSNTSFSTRAVVSLLRNVGLANYVDVVVSSSDVGHVKPQKFIFQVLVSSVGVKPAEIVHVGDSCVEDVLGALSSGLRAIYYTGLLPLRMAEPSPICLNLVPAIESLSELPKVIQSIK
ncbi:MAG: HAD-IA family hydrolase, partial [Sulfolobales archaeon]|nr:HAD-IA family hydrolase [Sulfolobales archaeon]